MHRDCRRRPRETLGAHLMTVNERAVTPRCSTEGRPGTALPSGCLTFEYRGALRGPLRGYLRMTAMEVPSLVSDEHRRHYFPYFFTIASIKPSARRPSVRLVSM